MDRAFHGGDNGAIDAGTPAGVGPVQVGNTITVTVEGLGSLTNKVVADR
jgi:2-keto-4-pentenoate hydratase/2-oxohepta-3-ene-1,7-dioic acid hydratase in catechol pathway